MLAPAYREVRGAWEARDRSASKSARCAVSLAPPDKSPVFLLRNP